MTKYKPSHQDHVLKSKFSSADGLQRRPIHNEEIQENDIEEYEEDDIDEINSELLYDNLYPDLKEDLAKIKKQDKFCAKGNRKSKESYQSSKNVSHKQETVSCSFEEYFAIFKKYVLYILGVICPVAFFLVYQGYFDFFFPQPIHQVTDVNILIKDMQNHFSEQKTETFKVLKLALKQIINVEHEPDAPAIITILANKGAENRASDFSLYVATDLASGRYVSFNESAPQLDDPLSLKMKIDEKIESKLGDGKLNVVIVDKFHNIPFEAALIFHGYCDHESAQFKHAVYLFIVHLQSLLPENSRGKDLDRAAMTALRNIWLSATDDKVDSLITRLTVNVINIR